MNGMIWRKVGWGIVILALFAALPLIQQRAQLEISTDTVDLVFDYEDMQRISYLAYDQREARQTMLAQLKESGITSMAVYETSLRQLKRNGHLDYYIRANSTIIVFTDAQRQADLTPLLYRSFGAWNFRSFETTTGQKGLELLLPIAKTETQPLGFSPYILNEVRDAGLQIVARITPKRVYNQQEMDLILEELSEAYGVRWILFDGLEVAGFPDKVASMAEIMKKYSMGSVNIEFTKQAGIPRLSATLDYNTVRLHSIKNEEMSTYTLNRIVDRFVLAAHERNIRMLFFRPAMKMETNPTLATGVPLPGSIDMGKTLDSINQISAKLQTDGFNTGSAEKFVYQDAAWKAFAVLIVALGGIALIALTAYELLYILPETKWANPLSLLLLAAMVGLLGLSWLVGRDALMLKLIALGAGVSGATLGIIKAVQYLSEHLHTEQPIRKSVISFGIASLHSLIGATIIIGILHHIRYSLYLDQFAGVKALHVLPMLGVGLFLFFFTRLPVWKVLNAPIRVYHSIAVAVVGMIGVYYVMRTGNEGAISGLELTLRGLLDETLGVRPRTKEFLLGHPLFIVAAYVFIRTKKFPYLFLGAVIGQLSIVSTFTHIHTPLWISVWRVALGLGIGLGLGVLTVLTIKYASNWIWGRWVSSRS